MADQPSESTTEVDAALTIRAAVDELMRPGRSGGLLTDPVGPVERIMRAAKDLRPAKVDAVVAHLRDAYPEDEVLAPLRIAFDAELDSDGEGWSVGETQSDGLHEQIDELAYVISHEIEGEPSRSEGAVATAIRLLRNAYGIDVAEPGPDWPHHDLGDDADADADERRRAAADELAARVQGGES